ncbi:GyrI-like domain-containing protein [Bacillus sp. Marseille-Q1617]|uniref:GyrI-like domain-containing protein n=1 Tax=Bacillus sp. Marseille-Q1617 TaxID=2736887 RepID=UPI001588AD59|nr:GyrI-like domain-containing protein [Bacillus sp. Marseille-Q1617]
MYKRVINQKTIKSLNEIKLVGFRVLCEGEEYLEEIPKAARLLKERSYEIKNAVHPVRQVGAFVVEEMSKEEDGYWIGVQVEEYQDIPEGMVTLTVPQQTYAAIMHHGPGDQIRSSYEELHRWISEQRKERLNHGWNLEMYQEDNDPENPDDVRVELLDSIL